LIRPSNTTPILVLRFEADSESAIARIQADFKAAIGLVDPDLATPF
jgi:phosphomannomutase/phosphoglucomutase